jgi:hypothetical protein
VVAPSDSAQEEAELAFAAALERLGFRLTTPPADADLAVDLGDRRTVDLLVRVLANAAPSRVRRTIDATPDSDVVPVLVADAIPAASRAALEEHGWGWFDRRGHVRLLAPGMAIDTVAAADRRRSRPRAAITGRAGIVAAYALLRDRRSPVAVRRTAEASGMSPSSVSRAVARLREAALVQRDGTALVPDLFWELAGVWPRQSTALKRTPVPGDSDVGHWVLSGDAAALVWGAPIVVSGDSPPELLVPAESDLRRALQRYGRAPSVLAGAAFVRVAPAPAVLEPVAVRGDSGWPVAHPLAVALDLAADPTRGAEAVDGFTPPPPFERGW